MPPCQARNARGAAKGLTLGWLGMKRPNELAHIQLGQHMQRYEQFRPTASLLDLW
jgi:hypothetical protein